MFVENITTEVVASNLHINFNSQDGIAKISIKNEEDKVVYSTTAAARTSAEVIFAASSLESDVFIVEVA